MSSRTRNAVKRRDLLASDRKRGDPSQTRARAESRALLPFGMTQRTRSVPPQEGAAGRREGCDGR